MNAIEEFKRYLEAGNTSKSTVKNYKADVAQFFQWFESEFKSNFNPSSVNRLTLQNYSNYQLSHNISGRSVKRHISSIKKFMSFLKSVGYEISEDVFQKKDIEQPSDPWRLKEFKEFLYNNNSSPLTIKNYINDVRLFLKWAEEVTKVKDNWEVANKDIFSVINGSLINEYKDRLINSSFAPNSINRKLSSLTKYFDWKNTSINIPRVKHVSFDPEVFKRIYQQELKPIKSYSKFPPLRLIQKISKGISLGFDSIFIIPLSKIMLGAKQAKWKFAKRPLMEGPEITIGSDYPLKRLKKEIYAPHAISTRYFPKWKKLLFHIRHTRPNWYKNYHSYRLVHALHASILLFMLSLFGLLFYQRFQAQNKVEQSVLGSESIANRTFVFTARLTDENNIPITKPSDIRVGLYSDSVASGSALLWQDELSKVSPNPDGQFTIALGENQPLPQSVFNNNYQLYLGLSVGSNSELTPRLQIPTASYAQNSDSVQGLAPITAPNVGTNNVLLALDSSGNLTIGGQAHPTFTATGGEFKLSGNQLTLATNPGSSTDVVISPDGQGLIDLQKPIHNTSNYNNAQNAIGSVEVDDLLSVLATSDAESAFTVDQNGSGNLISGYGNGSAKFTVDSSGNSFIAGNLGIGTQIPLQKVEVKGNILLSDVTPTLFLGPKNYIGYDSINTIIYSATGDIVVHPATSSAFRPFSDNIYSLGSQSFRWNSLNVGDGSSSFAGKIGIGTTNPAASLQVSRNSQGSPSVAILEQGTGDLLVASSSVGSKFVISNSGNVGIGVDSPSTPLTVSSNASATTGAIANITNHNTSDTTGTSVLALGIGASVDSQNARFVQFFAGATDNSTVGTGVGRIRSNGSAGNGAVAYESGAADFAEYFDKGEDLAKGTIVELNADNKVVSAQNSSNMLGVVSQTGAFIGNLPKDGQEQSKVIVGLLGQIDVLVDTQNGIIKPNDAITISQIPGIGEKAITAGKILGRAMEGFDGSNGTSCAANPSYRCSAIKVLVNPSWFDPNVFLTNSGDLNISKDLTTQTFSLSSQLYGAITNLGAFEDAVIANVTAGFINAKDIATQTLTAQNKITSPIAEVDQIHTNVISPLSPNGQIAVRVESTAVSVTNGQGTTVAEISNTGDVYAEGSISARSASFSGNLSSNSLQTVDATFSGTLHASRIVADEIVGLQSATTSAITQYNQLPTSSVAAELNNVTADFGQFNQGLIALGPTALTDLTVTDQLSVGSSLTLSDNSINVLGQDLKIQPLQLGGVSFEGGLVSIDTSGNLTTKNITVNGLLAASLISPIPDSDLIVQLSSSPIHNSSFIINNSSGSAVFAVNQQGDITTSGSATFGKLNLSLVSPAFAVSNVEVIATGSAGVASIKSHQMELTIKNSLVTEKSLIYITPVGTPSGQTPFLQRQTPSDSFTVGIEEPEFSDTTFNWLIIN